MTVLSVVQSNNGEDLRGRYICHTTESDLAPPVFEAKSRKYQGVFEVKRRVKTWQIRGIWSQQLEHKQVPQ